MSSVQVLSVEADGRYSSDAAALRRVAEAAAARALPVAVVSVAGATRGGKSFLLDFFLRYLRAPEAARRSGAWLGEDDDPLTGFSWRGGCERDTQGIQLWSEPIVVTLGSGENSKKVAVVLMDTQGTFDSSSTVRDSSTVFAMSTLLSSVQIYNLSHNIQEDDLQYLQLFTEYGRLVRDEEAGTPFQELQFLVRDWSYAYEHPYGAEGGQQLLEKRLEIRPEQASELREIRLHVRSTFERVRCFLLPHPGLTVATSPHFTGCPADISSEFKKVLLELVPSIFSSENLTVKKIDGQEVTLQDLPEYFKTYLDIFNSDSLPTPMTVMQATSIASLEVALSAVREAYCSHMELRSGTEPVPSSAWVPRSAVPRMHAEAMEAARAAFTARRLLAAPLLTTARFEKLLQDLDALLPQYVAINKGRILVAMAASKAVYEETVHCQSCLSADELAARHDAAAEAARAALSAARCGEGDDDEEDEHWQTLQKELEQLLPLNRERNEERIAAASAAARARYAADMRGAAAAAPCRHPRALLALHRSAADAAAASFHAEWHDADTAPPLYEEALMADIEEQYQEFVAENNDNNNRAVKEALDIYHIQMSEIFGDASLCLHPSDLLAEHERLEGVAVAYFLEQRDAAGRELSGDHFKQSVLRGLISLFLTFQKQNAERNNAAVESAHGYYIAHIAPVRLGPEGLLEVFGPIDFGIFSRHESIKDEALEHFGQKRRPGGNYVADEYLDDLNKKIRESYGWLVLKLVGGVGMAGLNIAFLTSMWFLRR